MFRETHRAFSIEKTDFVESPRFKRLSQMTFMKIDSFPEKFEIKPRFYLLQHNNNMFS